MVNAAFTIASASVGPDCRRAQSAPAARVRRPCGGEEVCVPALRLPSRSTAAGTCCRPSCAGKWPGWPGWRCWRRSPARWPRCATWNVDDPSFSNATANAVTNAAGYPGAVFADLAMQFFGLAAVPLLVPPTVWALLMVGAREIGRPVRRGLAWLGGTAAGRGDRRLRRARRRPGRCHRAWAASPATWCCRRRLPSPGGYPHGVIGVVIALAAGGAGAVAAALCRRAARPRRAAARAATATRRADEVEDEDDEPAEGLLALGALTHWWLSARAFLRRRRRRHADPSAAAQRTARPPPATTFHGRRSSRRRAGRRASSRHSRPMSGRAWCPTRKNSAGRRRRSPSRARVAGPAQRPRQGARVSAARRRPR